MKKVLALILAVAMIASVAVLAGCSGDKKDGDKKDDAKTYIIYSDNAFAPFEYLDTKSNEYIGVDMDIMTTVRSSLRKTAPRSKTSRARP